MSFALGSRCCLLTVALAGQVPVCLLAQGPLGQTDLDATAHKHGVVIAYALHRQDQGPQGLYIDYQGHDVNDDTVARVTYNNQEAHDLHIESIYVHGENIVTQGRIQLDIDIPPGVKKELVIVRRDKKGLPAKVYVDIHAQ